MLSVLWVVAFPQELFDHIIELTKDDRSTLYNLCLVSRAICLTAQRYLYRRVALGGVRIKGKGRNRWSLNNLVNRAFFSTLVKTQHLALHVRDLYFRPDVGDGGASDGTSPWRLFHQALHQMTNLKRLQITLMTSDQASSRILEALGDHTFQLEAFSWMDYRFKMAANESETFVSFLLSQPKLLALNILAESLHLELPERSCPNLSTFVGTFAHALRVLRIRPITNFVWTAPFGSKPRPYMTVFMKASFSKLRVLILHDHVPVELDYRADLMNCFQSLEALHISLTPNSVYQPGSICILAVSDQLSLFRCHNKRLASGSYRLPVRSSCAEKFTHGCINRNNSRSMAKGHV